MRRVRLGLALVVAGVFFPLIGLFYADGYDKRLSVLENIQGMTVCVTAHRTRPDFQATDDRTVWPGSTMSDSRRFIPPPPVPDDALAAGKIAILPNGEHVRALPNGDPVVYDAFYESTIKDEISRADTLGDFDDKKGKRWRYCGPRFVKSGLYFEYRSFVILGGFLLAAGCLLLAFCIGRRPVIPIPSSN